LDFRQEKKIYNLLAHRAQAHLDPPVQEIFDETLYL